MNDLIDTVPNILQYLDTARQYRGVNTAWFSAAQEQEKDYLRNEYQHWDYGSEYVGMSIFSLTDVEAEKRSVGANIRKHYINRAALSDEFHLIQALVNEDMKNLSFALETLHLFGRYDLRDDMYFQYRDKANDSPILIYLDYIHRGIDDKTLVDRIYEKSNDPYRWFGFLTQDMKDAMRRYTANNRRDYFSSDTFRAIMYQSAPDTDILHDLYDISDSNPEMTLIEVLQIFIENNRAQETSHAHDVWRMYSMFTKSIDIPRLSSNIRYVKRVYGTNDVRIVYAPIIIEYMPDAWNEDVILDFSTHKHRIENPIVTKIAIANALDVKIPIETIDELLK